MTRKTVNREPVQFSDSPADNHAVMSTSGTTASPVLTGKAVPADALLVTRQPSLAGHIDSYYAASAIPAPAHPTLDGDIEVDVCVIGGGISGCSTALHLAERGYRVALLEGQRIGWGASGRSGGQAIVGFASGQERIEREVGLDHARRMWDVSVESLALLKQLVSTYRIDCDLHFGQLHVAIKDRQRDELLRDLEHLERKYAYRQLRLLERDAIGQLLATPRYCAGLYDAGSAHLHPLNYTLGLAAAARQLGAEIFEHSSAIAVEPGDMARIRTARGLVQARYVALCCNAYIDDLAPRLRSRIMPVGTYIVATQPLGEARITGLIRENVAVTDTNFVLDYFRRSADHRLLFGGRVSYSGLDAFDTKRATRKRMLKVFPQLADAAIEYAWGGYVDITLNRAPDFGRLAPNVYYLQGFSGHGIALTAMAGQLVAEAIAGHAERFDLFTRIKHRNFPGGQLLRTPALVLAMLWYRMRDIL